MGRLLNKYANEYTGDGLGASEKKVRVSSDIFNLYKRAKEKGTTIECTFDFADAAGNLSLEDANGITVTLYAENFQKDAPYYSKRMKDRFLGLNMMVKVSEIDEENMAVKVSSAGSRNSVKMQLTKEIMMELKKREEDDSLEPLTLWGDVIRVDEKSLMINILHRNILGFITRANWSQLRIRDLNNVVKVGDMVRFNVIAPAKRKPGKDIAFQLDRRPFAPDPWENLPDFEENSTMIVQCMQRPKGKSYWWGQSKKVPEIDIMCDYSQRFDVMRGCTYKCKVTHYDKEKHILKCVPFEQIDSGIFTAENVAFVREKKKREE